MATISPPKCSICGAQHWSYERHHVSAKPVDPLIAKREAQNKYQRDYQRRKREARNVLITNITDRPERADQAADTRQAPEADPTHH